MTFDPSEIAEVKTEVAEPLSPGRLTKVAILDVMCLNPINPAYSKQHKTLDDCVQWEWNPSYLIPVLFLWF